MQVHTGDAAVQACGIMDTLRSIGCIMEKHLSFSKQVVSALLPGLQAALFMEILLVQ